MAARSAARPRSGGRSPEAVPAALAGAVSLDTVVHGRLRLGILSVLSAAPSLTFVELKELLSATDGNLSVHARKLESAGYVVCEKGFEGRVPRTAYRLTEKGRKALARYLDHMEAILRAARRR